MVQDSGFRVQDPGFRVWSSGFVGPEFGVHWLPGRRQAPIRIHSLGSKLQCSRFRVECLVLMIQCSEFRAEDSGLRVSGLGFGV